MGISHGWEVFYRAVGSAVTSNESLQERLGSVIMLLGLLQRESFTSDEMWERFRSLKEETTKCPATFRGEGTIHATTSQMSDEEARRLLNESFEIFNELAEAKGREDDSSLLSIEAD
jgi:hypothetical protein